MSIKTRLSLFAVLLLTLILVGHSLIVYFQSRDTVEQIVFAAAIMEAKQNAEIIETWIRGKGEKLSLLAKTTVIRNMNWMEQLPILQQVVAEEEEIESIFIADLTGRARSSSGEVIDISDREYFQEALKTGRTTYSQPVQSPSQAHYRSGCRTNYAQRPGCGCPWRHAAAGLSSGTGSANADQQLRIWVDHRCQR